MSQLEWAKQHLDAEVPLSQEEASSEPTTSKQPSWDGALKTLATYDTPKARALLARLASRVSSQRAPEAPSSSPESPNPHSPEETS